MQGKITPVRWEDIRLSVKAVNPRLAKVIDKISPSKEFILYKVSYPFGATVVDKGLFHLPLPSGEIVPISDTRINPKVYSDLGYAKNGMPVGVTLKNSYEVFINAGHHTIPVITATPGSIIALWKQLDTSPSFHPANIFNITAGARSIFMLPNVGDAMMHRNLIKDFNVKKQPPKDLLDQWPIFKAIAEHENCSWNIELIFFPEKWLKKAKTDTAWHELYLLLLENAWESSGFERNQIFYEFALSCAQANRDLKPNPYLLDTARHLLSIILGSTCGFKPATDELMAPIKLIQEAYVNSYGLTKYIPTLLHPAHFDAQDQTCPPIYYSFQLPTTISFSPRSRQLTSTLFDLKELKYIMDIFIDEIVQRNVHLENTVIDMIIPKLRYAYFHSKPDLRDNILSSAKIIEQDSNFAKTLYQNRNAKFAYNGTFIRGCIKIGHSKNDSAIRKPTH